MRLVRDDNDLTRVMTSGRLDVYLPDEWGTVCGLVFNQEAADLACRQLGFLSALQFGIDLGSV